MRHHKVNRKFGRVKKVRKGLLKSLVFGLVRDGRIMTTDAKARELRPTMEKLITTGKIDNLANKKLLISRVGTIAASKIVKDISPKYLDRKGGYTRITKLPDRKSDGSKMAVIEFV